MAYTYEVGDIVKLKKKHPCGSFEWEILRVGADFRLKCTGCGHQIMTPRKMVEKNLDFVLIKEMTGLTEQELNALKKRN